MLSRNTVSVFYCKIIACFTTYSICNMQFTVSFDPTKWHLSRLKFKIVWSPLSTFTAVGLDMCINKRKNWLFWWIETKQDDAIQLVLMALVILTDRNGEF